MEQMPERMSGVPAISWIVLHWVAMLLELIGAALCFATCVEMLLPKGKDFRNSFITPPYRAWATAAVLGFLEG